MNSRAISSIVLFIMSSTTLYKNPEKSAKIAGLRYVSDQQPGIQRKRWGRGFSYIDVDGKRIKDRQRRAQFEALVIPPSWRKVWICCDENGHLRATGRDLKNRKQYRYHPNWIALRKQLKFDRLIPFAEALPRLRAQTQATIEPVAKASRTSAQPISRKTVIAATVQLLDETFIRIGNAQYAEANQSHGLTTLTTEHIKISSSSITLRFVGKSGVNRKVSLRNAQLANILKRCEEIPGQSLFQYINEAGEVEQIESGDVNTYLQTVMGEAFTAKDFRTWGGTVTAANALYQVAKQNNQQSKPLSAEEDLGQAVKTAAKQLGNRPATCRKYYIHPRIFELYKAGGFLEAIAQHPLEAPDLLDGLDADEQRTLSALNASQKKQHT